jgi:hypothetical protein
LALAPRCPNDRAHWDRAAAAIALANLQAGIAYALGQIGRGIPPLEGRARGA